MSLTDIERGTTTYYNTSGLEWSIAHGDEVSIWSNEIKLFMDLLPGGDILEIGSGVGKEAETFISRGYRYLGIDPSIGLARLAKKRNPDGVFINASVYNLPSINRKFDGFWAAASLLHVPKNRIDETLNRIRESLYPAGYGFISLKEGDGQIVDDKGRVLSYYLQEEFAEVLDQNGFNILRNPVRVDGKLLWLLYYLQKR